MTVDPRPALDAIGELLPPEAIEELYRCLAAVCSRPEEGWVVVEVRCKGRRVTHAEVSARKRISAIDRKSLDPRGRSQIGE